MTTNLESLVQGAVKTRAKILAEEKVRQEEARQIMEHNSEVELYKAMEQVLTEEFMGSVTWRYVHSYASNGTNKSHNVSACFTYGEYDWHIGRSLSHWTIFASQKGRDSAWSHKASGVTGPNLQATLFLYLAEYAQEQADRKAKEESRRFNDEHTNAIRRRQIEEAEAANQAKKDALVAEHKRLSALVDDMVTRTRADLWRWPEGVTIEVYHMEYCKGSMRDEDGEASFDYAGGWTRTSDLDINDRVTLEESMRYASAQYPAGAKTVQLIPAIHHPVFTVHTFSSTEELPESLRQEVRVGPENVVMRSGIGTGFTSLLMEVERPDYDEHWYTVPVGSVPLEWIKELVDANN